MAAVSPFKLIEYLTHYFPGKKTYESTSFLDKTQDKSAYGWIKTPKYLRVRISNHIHPSNKDFDIEILLSKQNFDFSINEIFYPNREGLSKSQTMEKIKNIIKSF